MFYLLRKLRSIFKTLRSEVAPHEIACGAALGILAGFAPLGRHLLLPLLLILLLRNTLGVTMVFFAVGRLLGAVLSTKAFDLGVRALREGEAFDGLMSFVSNAPVLGLLGLNRYVVFGSWLIALPLAVAAYLAMRFFTVWYRGKLVAWTADRTLYQRIQNRPWFRIGRWILMGGAVKEKAARAVALPWRVLRRSMVYGLPILVVLGTVGGVLAVNFGLGRAVIWGVEGASGKPTAVRASWANPFVQRVGLDGLVVDEASPSGRLLGIETLHLDLDMLSLLSGRLRIPEARIEGLTLRLVRAADGSLNIAQAPVVTGRAPGEPPTEAEEGYWEWVQEEAADADWLELIGKTVEFIKARRAEQAGAPAPTLPYDPEAAERYEATQPFFRLDHLALVNFRLEMIDERPGHEGALPTINTFSFTLDHLSSDRGLLGEEIICKIQAGLEGEVGGKLDLVGRVPAPQQAAAGGDVIVEAKVDGIELPAWAALFQHTLPLDVVAGELNLDSSLVFAQGALKPSSAALALTGLRLEQRPGTTLLGLDERGTHWFLRGINALAGDEEPLEIDARARGPLENLDVAWETDLLEHSRRGLERLARDLADEEAKRYLGVLAARIDELEILGAGAGGELGTAVQEGVLDPLLKGKVEEVPDKVIEAGAKKGKEVLEREGQKALGDLLRGGNPFGKKDDEEKKDKEKLTDEEKQKRKDKKNRKKNAKKREKKEKN